MNSSEPLAARPFPLARGLVLRVAHAISEGRAAADAIRASRANLPVTAAPA